jgi:hypothetical protein
MKKFKNIQDVLSKPIPKHIQEKVEFETNKMKNTLGTEENLELFNENGVRVYEYRKESNGYCYEYTYDSNGKYLTFKDSLGFSSKYTRDAEGKELTYENFNGEKRFFNVPKQERKNV